MDPKLAVLMALAWLRLQLQIGKTSTPHGALSWRWSLGVKHDIYGYTLAVYRVRSSQYVVRLIRSRGASTDLRSTTDLHSAMRTAQMVQREYGKAARIANERDMRALAEISF